MNLSQLHASSRALISAGRAGAKACHPSFVGRAMAAIGLCAVFAGGIAPAAAQTLSERYNTIELSAEAQREVANDTLSAALYMEANGATAAEVANTLNRAINDALKQSAEVKAVRARSGNNQTWPLYNKAQQITGWRGRAEIRLESRDFTAAAALVGRLQSTLQLASLQFSVSPEARKAAENELITEAVAAFRARADVVRQALAGKGYKLRRLAISTGGFAPPRPLMARAMAAASAAEVAAPQFEGGMSQVTVTASGAVEIE
jgi:predicted secreted protein